MSAGLAFTNAAPAIPFRYWAWLGGATLASLGTQVMGFSMAWVAAGHGGAFAGLVLTAINLPRTLLLLIGGAAVDRVGAWRVMLSGDAVMTIMTGLFAGALLVWGPGPWLLVGFAILLGLVDAFYLPAAGSMPRRLVPDARLAQAMSARQISVQISAVLGGPIGALIMASFGLVAAAVMNSATFAAMFVLLLLIRPANNQFHAGDGAPASGTPAIGPKPKIGKDATDGLRLSLQDPLLRPGLLMLMGCAAFLLPVVSLLLPVLARQHGWEPTSVGLVFGVSAGCTAAVAIWVLVSGGLARPGIAGACGLAAAALGILGLAVFPGQGPLLASGALIGFGTGLFSTHIGPLLLGRTPPTHLGRVQAVVALAQSVPLLLSNFALGSLAQFAGAKVSLGVCAAALTGSAALALGSKQLRAARRPGPDTGNQES